MNISKKLFTRTGFLIILFLTFSIASTWAGVNEWTFLGPEGGKVEKLVIHPNNPDIVYAGTFTGGIFKTTDGGQNWIAVNKGLTELSIRGLVMASDNPDTLYTSTWDSGVFKTTDGGMNWTEINNGLSDKKGYALVIVPGNPDTLYLGGSGVHKSTDGGMTWVEMSNGLKFYSDSIPKYATVWAMATVPGNPDTLYAASGGVYKTTDGGQNWVAVNNGLMIEHTEHNVYYDYLYYNLFVSKNNPDIVYAGTLQEGLLFKSTDGGMNWTQIGKDLPGYRELLTVSEIPGSPDTLYVSAAAGSGMGIYKSTDRGMTFTQVQNGLNAKNASTFVSAPNNPDILYAGTCGGVYKSTDRGQNWIQMNKGLNAQNVFRISLASDVFYAATYGSGIYKSTDRGQHWVEVNNGLSNLYVGRAVQVRPDNSDVVYAVSNVGIHKSTDGGLNWTEINNGLPESSRFLSTFFLVPNQPDTIYTSSYSNTFGVYKTTDGGQNWVEINKDLLGEFVSCFMAATDNSGLLYAGTDNGVFKTSDHGQTWISVNNGLSDKGVSSLVGVPDNPNIIYAKADHDIYKTTDGGENWTEIGKSEPAASFVLMPGKPDTLYGMNCDFENDISEGGIYRSTDGGMNWMTVNKGLSNTKVTSLAVLPDEPDTVYAGIAGGGVFVFTDNLPPSVLSIVRTGDEITSADTLTFAVTFSEKVSGIDTGDFELITDGSVSGTVASVSASEGAGVTVSVSGIIGTGTLGLRLKDNDSIINADGTALGGYGTDNGDFATGETYRFVSPGDVDGSGKIEPIDAVIALRRMASGDIESSGLADVIVVLRVLTGVIAK